MSEKKLISGEDFMGISKAPYMAAKENAEGVPEESFAIRNIPKFLHANPRLEENFQKIIQWINDTPLEDKQREDLISAIVDFQTTAVHLAYVKGKHDGATKK